MDIEFEDPHFKDLAFKAGSLGGWSPGIVRKFREVILYFQVIENRTSIYNWKGLKCEKLKANYRGQWSVRLNDKWRVRFRVRKNNGKEVLVIICIEDYHN